jgi:hypothetical protein
MVRILDMLVCLEISVLEAIICNFFFDSAIICNVSQILWKNLFQMIYLNFYFKADLFWFNRHIFFYKYKSIYLWKNKREKIRINICICSMKKNKVIKIRILERNKENFSWYNFRSLSELSLIHFCRLEQIESPDHRKRF